MCPNIPELLIAHFAIPLAGGVLVAMNARLATEEVGYICRHAGAKLLMVDSELRRSCPAPDELGARRVIITVSDPSAAPDDGDGARPQLCGIAGAWILEPLPWTAPDEQATISINYTSGTTGDPKGVAYTHRGAYLNSLGEVIHSEHLPTRSTSGRSRCFTATGGARRGE